MLARVGVEEAVIVTVPVGRISPALGKLSDKVALAATTLTSLRLNACRSKGPRRKWAAMRQRW
jgi:hypothetical protein